ncbi:MAG: metallophosphoesterase [Candidatus Helarchaeota archaeon]|nr:metallophosphoesterase [Candidatus Helarchaeota archaeon]
MKILHLSDTHIHAISNNDSLEQRLNCIEKMDHKIIITGDITDDGTKEQYDVASKILSPFNDRIYLDPGNHDYGVIGSFYTEEAAKRFDDFAKDNFISKNPLVHHLDGVTLIILNSNLKTSDPFDFACGEIGRGQLFALKEILDNPSVKDSIKIVCLHHHPFIHNDPTMELLDVKNFLRTIYGKIDILLFGHKHLSGKWINQVGCRLVLASGATFQDPFAWEITIEGNKIFCEEVSIT